ncbi:DUF368 domain-containing protein [Aurantibacter crassamenti]|uniref:DUF368 domain-containing protein n=1 Tax=Aurantibacter crassamenti TaxID=1837375 RepID=UPI0019399986|nr:DUF368 domain-containing protein [Aurantibacter crassamenti]MBM1108187.1 DUF368 domain-containing protein [Aurantibacter crassamenti]
MEQRNLFQTIVIILKGMAMGIAELVPGVSGGTIAFVAGIYEEFITSLNNLNLKTLSLWRTEGFQSFWKTLNGKFLVTLFAGMLISIFSFSKLISWLLDAHPIPLWAFFFGLVLASVFFVGKAIKKWTIFSAALLVIGAVVAFYITKLPPSENSDSLIYLFFSGALAICAMILPGISGSFILVLLGSYKTVLDAVHERDFKIILTVGLGVIFGLLSFAKVLKWMFNNYKDITLAVLTGFILGSLNKIWPWKLVLETRMYGDKEKIIAEQSISPFAFEGDSQLMSAIIAAIIGFSLIFILERTASKSN